MIIDKKGREKIMEIADRLKNIPPYLFMELRNKINRAKAEGIDVISLAIGDPVEPTPQPVIEELCRRAMDPENHRYPIDEEKGMLSFRKAVSAWYMERYKVYLDPEREVLALIGSKEGCHHFVLSVVNPGDVVLMTDPGYPAYRASILMAGGEPYGLPIKEENRFLPKLEDVPSDVARMAKAMFINYPNNPTGAVASDKFFQEVVAFAKEFDILVCHDNPYSEFVFDGETPRSFLMAEGAKDSGIELNSLSKPFNMTGWRIGMAVGNPEIIRAMAKVKENTDSGIFNPIQYAGIKAIKECKDNISKMLSIYERRRRAVLDCFYDLGWKFSPMPGTFYLWIPVPEGFSSI
jgi:LL-diaminopimelate aminotransferase